MSQIEKLLQEANLPELQDAEQMKKSCWIMNTVIFPRFPTR